MSVSSSPTYGHSHDSSYDTSTRWFQEADSGVIYISCENLFHNRAKLDMFKLKPLNAEGKENDEFKELIIYLLELLNTLVQLNVFSYNHWCTCI